MKGLDKAALELKFKSPDFLGDYKTYYFEFTTSRAKLNGEYLKKQELYQFISIFDYDLAIQLLEVKHISYEDMAMHLMRGLFQFQNVVINSDTARLRVAMQQHTNVAETTKKEIPNADKEGRTRLLHVLRKKGIISGGYVSTSIKAIHLEKLFAIKDEELLTINSCGAKTLERINKFRNELKVLLSNHFTLLAR